MNGRTSYRHILRTDTWVKPYLRTYGRALALAITLGVLTCAFACGLMFTSGYMISLAALIPATVLALHLPSLIVRIFGIGKPLLHYAERLSSHDWVLRMTSEMRRKLYLCLEARTSALDGAAETTARGEMLAWLNEDIGHVQDLIMRSLLPLAVGWATSIVTCIACGVLSLPLLFILTFTLLLLAVVAPLATMLIQRASIMSAKCAQRRLYDALTDDVFGITDWVLSGRRQDCLHRMDEARAQRAQARAAIRRRMRWMSVACQALAACCIVAVLAWAAWAFGEGNATGALSMIAQSGSANAPAYAPDWVAAFILCLFPLLESVAALKDGTAHFVEQSDALERLNELSESHPDTAHVQPREGQRNEGAPDAAKDAAIFFDNVTFAYEGAPVISGLNLSVAPGEHVAIVGRSGSGKTTAAKLICGALAPQSGAVYVFGRRPHESAKVTGSVVGILHERPKLFHMTLRDNLRIAKPDATDDELYDALVRVGLEKRVGPKEQALNMMIAEEAFNVSGGEAHRIALARVLLANAPILILDEPLASLDANTAKAVLDTILETCADRTLVIITHEPQSLLRADRVIRFN